MSHFLRLADRTTAELRQLLRRASVLKAEFRSRQAQAAKPGTVLAMIFEKSSTRTRVSFETAMARLGGHAIFLAPEAAQFGRGEPMVDTARVLSKMVNAIMIRTYSHQQLERFAEAAQVPVINGLSDSFHPCQLLADMQTFFELRGDIQDCRVAWIGDGNNMCNTYLEAAGLFDFDLRIGCPRQYQPDSDLLGAAKGRVQVTDDPRAAVENADLVVTDVWSSMGQVSEAELEQRRKDFRPYQVDHTLMKLAAENAVFMHCLPAHRGEEVTAEVLEGAQSAVWEEAGNRLHAQTALLETLL